MCRVSEYQSTRVPVARRCGPGSGTGGPGYSTSRGTMWTYTYYQSPYAHLLIPTRPLPLYLLLVKNFLNLYI